MSARSEKVRKALYAKMNVPAVTTTAGASYIFHRKAPDSLAELYPYVVFDRHTVRAVTRAFGSTLIAEDDLWLVKVLAVRTEEKEAEELAETILAACESAIGSSLSLTGSTVWLVERVRDIPGYPDLVAGQTVHHHGFLLRVVTH